MWDVFPHPHIQGLFFAATRTDPACSTCDAPGVYAIQERWSPSTGTWRWMRRRLSQADLAVLGGDLVDWGGDADGHLSSLYLAAKGAGTWEATLDW